MIDQWQFGGIDFTLAGATSVMDLSGAQNLPPIKGGNAEIPMREGRYPLEKLFDQRTVPLGMLLMGSSINDFETKLDALKLLFGARQQQYLQRTFANGIIRRALAEVTKFDFKTVSPISAKITVEFTLADPFFRSITQVDDLQSIGNLTTNFSLTNPGTAPDRSAIITLTGPLAYPRLTNLTNGVWVGYSGIILPGAVVTINSSLYTCLNGAVNALASLMHFGDAYFMLIAPGANSMQFATTTTGGSVRIQFYPPFL